MSPPYTPPDGYMTPWEYALEHDRCASLITSMCRKGRIPGVKRVGQYWLIPKDAKIVYSEKENWKARAEKADALLSDVLKAFPGEDGVEYRLMHSDILERIRAHLVRPS